VLRWRFVAIVLVRRSGWRSPGGAAAPARGRLSGSHGVS
jgi:hypothetical protein